MKTMTWRVVGVTVVGLVLMGLTASVRAHMAIEKSQPAAGATVTVTPKKVQLWFGEEIDVWQTSFEVTGPAGPLDLGPTYGTMGDNAVTSDVKGPVPDGRYTVAWRTVDDGKAVKGEFAFTVKAAHAH